MGYKRSRIPTNKESHDLDKHLRLQKTLSSDRQVVKIGEDSTGLLLKDKDVLVEGDAEIGGDLTVNGDTTLEDLTITGNTITFGNSEVINNESDNSIVMHTQSLNVDAATSAHGQAGLILTSDADEDSKILFYEESDIKWNIGNDNDDSDKLKIGIHAVVGNNNKLILDTSGNMTLAGDIQVNGDDIKCDGAMNLEAEGGAITLDSSTGSFLAKKDGTQFSVANSAYAGMILGYTTVGIDATSGSYSITGTMTTVDDALKVKFVAPPSGVVEISIQVYFDAARRFPVLGLSDQDTGDTYRAISFPNATDVTNEHLVAGPPTSLGDSVLNNSWVVTGLTPGNAYEWWLGAKSTIGLGSVLRWGGTATNQYPPFIMKAVALPTAVTDYAVYG